MRRWWVAVALVSFVVSCAQERRRKRDDGDPRGEGGSAGSTGGAGGVENGTGGAGPSADAPTFLSLGTNVTAVLEGESITFSAVLTDPQGIDDLIGGTLKDPGGATYGAFATSGQEGSYGITLSWDQINQVAPITFDAGSSQQREFVAEFFDAAGNVATKSVLVTLACGPGLGACHGTCFSDSTESAACYCGSATAPTCAEYCTSQASSCFSSNLAQDCPTPGVTNIGCDDPIPEGMIALCMCD
jgi:hypothetical protein